MMSDHDGVTPGPAAGARRTDAPEPVGGESAHTPASEAPRPGPDTTSDLAAVAEAMAAVRTGVPTVGGPPSVPADDEVAALEHAHDALRTTLDRAERGG